MRFIGSKPHKEQLDRNDYHSLAIDCKIELDEVYANTSIFVVTGGNGIKIGITKHSKIKLTWFRLKSLSASLFHCLNVIKFYRKFTWNVNSK